MIDPGIFKAYDVRGIHGEQIDEDVAYRLGRGFARVLGELEGKRTDELRVGLGRDMRLAAPALSERYADGVRDEGARVLDVGAGSGAVALALKDERPDLSVVGTDVSAAALAVARANAARLGLDVEFLHGDLLAGIEACDAVLSNPPYVREGERAALAPEIVRHEPPGALFAGEDGLDVIRRLIAAAAGVAPLLAIEVGAGQAPAVAELMSDAGFADVSARRDLAGIARVVVGSR